MGYARVGKWEDLFPSLFDGGNIVVSEALFEYAKREPDFVRFLETDIGCDFNWLTDESATCICPLHAEDAPSFRVSYSDEYSLWGYYCFGCGRHGDIISFCKDYYNMDSRTAALEFVCEKFELQEANAILIEYKKKVNFRRKIECSNIVIANQCRLMLRRDLKKFGGYVADVYNRLNKTLDIHTQETLDKLSNIEFEVMKKAGA